MIYEYAIDPVLAIKWSDSRNFRFIRDKFGLGTPRIMCGYPSLKGWKKRVKRLINSELMTESDLKRIELLIGKAGVLTELVVERPKDLCLWGGSSDWLINAENEHKREPFRAIIAESNPRRSTGVIPDKKLGGGPAPLWDCPCPPVSRTSEAMAGAVSSMLRLANKIRFVDPHFYAGKERYRATYSSFLQAIFKGRENGSEVTIEIHTSVDNKDSDYVEDSKRVIDRYLPELTPKDATVNFYWWGERPMGEKIHNRYILTELGGVSWGTGLDQKHGDHDQTDDVSLLDIMKYNKRSEQYCSQTTCFEKVGTPHRIKGK